MLEAAAADATPWVERRDELARKAANAHAVDARAAMAAKDYPKRGDAANLIMKAVRNLSSAPAQVAIVRRFVDQSLMARNQLVKLLEEQGQQGAAFLELLIGGGDSTRRGSSPPASVTGRARRRFGAAGARRREDSAVDQASRDRGGARSGGGAQGLRRSCGRDCGVSKSGNVLYEINPLVELMLLDGLREHVIIGSSQQRTVHPDAMKWLARAVDATERVLVALGISFPGMPGDEKKAVIEDFLRLQGYDHPRPARVVAVVCERAGASVAVREGKDQVVNGTERLRGLVLDAALSAMSMWIDEKLAEVSIVLQNEANQAAIKVSAPAMCQEKASVHYFDCWSASSTAHEARRLIAAAAVAGAARAAGASCRWPNG